MEPGQGAIVEDAWDSLELLGLFDLDDEQFRAEFRKTPLWRARRSGVLRNAAIVLGNQESAESLPALQKGLVDQDPLVRGASAWAIGKIGTTVASRTLRERLTVEADGQVRGEIERALLQLAKQQQE